MTLTEHLAGNAQDSSGDGRFHTRWHDREIEIPPGESSQLVRVGAFPVEGLLLRRTERVAGQIGSGGQSRPTSSPPGPRFRGAATNRIYSSLARRDIRLPDVWRNVEACRRPCGTGRDQPRMTQARGSTTDVGRQELYRVFELCYGDVRRFFLRRGFANEEVGDLVQDTFVEVIRSWSSYRGDAPINGWVLGVAQNIYRSTLRYRNREKRDGKELPLDLVVGKGEAEVARPSPEDPLGRSLAAEQVRLVERAMRSLTREQRNCLVLRVDQQLSYREISKVLQISVEAAKSRVFQARRRLKEQLSDHFEIDLA